MGFTTDRVKKYVRRMGFEIKRIQPNTDAWSRRIQLIKERRVQLVLDVGANNGGYGKRLREAGYVGEIVSFEPQPGPYAQLLQNSRKDGNWSVARIALGDRQQQCSFSVSSRDSSSSLFAMTKLMRSAAAMSEVETILVKMCTLDGYYKENLESKSPVYLKCDVQGAEKLVMDGAINTLPVVEIVELELSLVPLYETYWDFISAIKWFEERGFEIWSIEPGFADSTSGRVYQVDAIFARRVKA